MMLSLLLAVGLGPAAPVARPAPGPAEVTAVSVMPGPGRAQVVIDVAGGVTVQDFTLRNPDRLVIDLVGASLAAPYVQYDGKNRGGILDVRYAQFRPDVVRVVLELERLTDYQVDYANGAVTVSLGTDRSFAAWSSGDGSWAKNLAQFAEASAAAAAPPAASAPPAQQAQSQQPPLTASWDNAPISDVIAGFAAFSGRASISSSISLPQLSSLRARVVLVNSVPSFGGSVSSRTLGRTMTSRTPQVSIQTRLVFVNRTELENLGIKYDLGSPTQFFNRLVQRGDPASAQPVDTDGDGVPDAVRPTEQFDADEVLVDLGGNSLSALANADAGVAGAALRLIFSTAIGNFNLTSFLEALETVELSDLQAEPVISTADNTQAYILVGERTPIRVVDVSSPTTGAAVTRATVDYQQTGILLRVTPHVTANRQVLMRLRAENSSVVAAPGDIGFTFQTQEAENQILVNDGETAVIGGLTVTQVTVSKSGIPFLVDLPILGRIFGFTSRREIRRDLLVLVTPHIVDDLPGASPPDRL
ncbi:MAG: AMIN domain-containing protein [Gemmatimonadetes bacterium]|nr:AMIN domain-containing protein [Gemmatimonadota bacterium]